MKKWYVLHTKMRAEKRVVAALNQCGIETFLPMIQSSSGRKKHKKVALFPGYLFMHADLEEEKTRHWRWVPGVHHVVAYGDKPVALPDKIIYALKHEIALKKVVDTRAGHHFRDRGAIRNTEVSFAEIRAILKRSATAQRRNTVLLTFLDRICRGQVDLEYVDLTMLDQSQKRPRRTRGRGRLIRSENS